MTPDEMLALIRQLELKYRQEHSEHTLEQLEKRADSFLGLFCIPMMYQWVKYTKRRHKGPDEIKLNDVMQRILEQAVKADTLDEKLIAIEFCMNARHQTNEFRLHLEEVSRDQKTSYQHYYETGEEGK